MPTNQSMASAQQYVGAASTYDSRNESLLIFSNDLGQSAPKNESQMDFKEGYRISDDGKITNLG